MSRVKFTKLIRLKIISGHSLSLTFWSLPIKYHIRRLMYHIYGIFSWIERNQIAPAVERALDVIELVVVSERDLSFSEIMKRINILRQSLIRILNSLCDRGVVERTEKRGFYRVGMRFLYLGARLKDKITLRTVA